MSTWYLTPDQIASAIRDVEARRAVRNAEGTKAAEGVPKRSPPDLLSMLPIDIGSGPRRLTEQEAADAVPSYRATYTNYDDAELVSLMEERLVAAMKADGYALPPLPAADKLKALRARQMRQGNVR